MNFLRKHLCAALALFAVSGLCRADCKLQQITDGGVTKIVIENDLVRATFTPDQGGECTGLVVKTPGGEHNDFTVGLFNDMDYSHSFADQAAFSGVPYTFTILENKPDVVSVAFDRQGVQDFAYVSIHKVMTLRDHERAIEADYEVRNLPVSMSRKTIRLWLHNSLYPTGLKGNYYWATSAGLESHVFPKAGNYWNTKAPRGWSGVVNDPASSGVACVVDYKDLLSLYDWMGTTAGNVEWRYQPQDILSGNSYRTTMLIVPFAGLDHIDHAGATGVYAWEGLSTDGTAATANLELAASRTESLSVEVRLRPTGSQTDQVLVSTTLQGDPTGVVKLPVAVPGLQSGRYVVSTQVTLPDGTKDVFEKLINIGAMPDTGDYSYVGFEVKNPNREAVHYAPYELSTAFVTKHIPWFTPYAGGPVKTLFVIPWFQDRSAVEVNERVSLKLHAPILGTGDSLYFSGQLPPLSDNFEEKTDAYWSAFEDDLTKNQDYDAVVLTFPWSQVPADVRTTLLGLMAKGIGLIVPANTLDDKTDLGLLFKNSTNRKVIPLPGGSCTWSTATVTLPPAVAGQAPIQGVETRLCSFEGPMKSYGFCRSLLWVSHHDPTLDASINWPSTLPITRVDLVAQGCPLRVHAVEAPSGVTALTVVSQDDVPVYSHEDALDLNAGDTSKTLPLPLLPSGQYDCQVSLKSHGQILATALAPVTVTDPVTIDGINLPQAILPIDTPAKGTAVFRNVLTTPVIRQYRFALVDSYDRTVDQTAGTVSIPPSGLQTVDFSLADPNPLAVVHKVVVTLVDAGAVVATQSTQVTYPDVNYPADDYLSFTWPDGGGLGDRSKANYLLHDVVGFNMEFGRNFDERIDPPFQREFSFGGIGPAYNDWSASNVRTSRKFSLTEPKTRATIMGDFTKMADGYAPYGVFGFDAADEPSLSAWEESSELDFSPTSMAGFAIWIQKKYPTLDDLNAEWGTTYKTWDEVSPLIESEAKDRDNLAPWNDFRDYMEDQWTDFLRELRDRALKNNPKALFGVCGVQDGHPYSGFDMWKIHDICNMVMPYTNSAVSRSFTPNGRFGEYTGYRVAPDVQIQQSWANFFDDQSIYSYFLGTYPVNSDFSISHTYADPITQSLTLFQGGVGKLLMDVPRQNDRIAIHYSQSSIRVNYMLKYRENAANDFLGLYRQDRLDYEGLLHDMGYDASYVSYGQIEAGDLTPAKYRVLILPLSTALSPKEVKAIRAYAAAGGIVIADGLTGIYDDHGKPNPTGSLDDLFGITRHQAPQNRFAYTNVTLAGQPKPLQFCVETGIDAGTAKPLFTVTGTSPTPVAGSVPGLAYTRTVGQGHTVYLDFLNGYARAIPQSAGVTALFRAVLANVGIAPPAVTATTQDGQPAAVQLLRHQAPGEKSLYLGLLQRAEMPAFTGPVTVHLPVTGNVYDLISGHYIGQANTITATLAPGIGQLYSVLPYRVTGVALEAPARAKAGQNVNLNFTVKTSGGAAETHVLHLTATGPDGTVVPYLTRNLLAASGKCATTVPFALDAPAGKWTFQVKDVSSGAIGSASVGVGN